MISKLYVTIFTSSLLFATPHFLQAEQNMSKAINEQGSIKLYVQTGCPYCDKVIAYLQRIGKLDQVVLMNIKDPQNFADLKKLSGSFQRPFLHDEPRNVSMLESDDIIKYFSTRF